MFGRVIRGGLSALKWALCAIGVLATVLILRIIEDPPYLARLKAALLTR